MNQQPEHLIAIDGAITLPKAAAIYAAAFVHFAEILQNPAKRSFPRIFQLKKYIGIAIIKSNFPFGAALRIQG